MFIHGTPVPVTRAARLVLAQAHSRSSRAHRFVVHACQEPTHGESPQEAFAVTDALGHDPLSAERHRWNDSVWPSTAIAWPEIIGAGTMIDVPMTGSAATHAIDRTERLS